MDTSEKQIKRIVLNRMERCAVCHRVYAPEDIHVVSRRADMWMMVVACAECHARNFVAAVIGNGDPGEAQLALRRLSRQHAEQPVDLPDTASDAAAPVTVDDVIDMHEFLKGFDGDFQRLFRTS